MVLPARECSELLEPLLDGHMWHSSAVEEVCSSAAYRLRVWPNRLFLMPMRIALPALTIAYAYRIPVSMGCLAHYCLCGVCAMSGTDWDGLCTREWCGSTTTYLICTATQVSAYALRTRCLVLTQLMVLRMRLVLIRCMVLRSWYARTGTEMGMLVPDKYNEVWESPLAFLVR